jgi:electron transport complex protein RnfC
MATAAHRLWQFHGGLHLPGDKNASTRTPVGRAPLPAHLILPLQQHIGETATPLVKVGEHVLKGQKLAAAEGYVSVPLHASSSGTVVEIGDRPVPHPSGLKAPCIVIETDGRDSTLEMRERPAWRELQASALRNLIREAGIVGLGGAGFPSFIKLNAGPRMQVDTLILNGAECEPSITCDDMLMRERAGEVLAGADIMRHVLQARACVIGVEDNKPQAMAALRQAASQYEDIDIIAIPTLYPTGGEKQLIRVLTGKEVPSHGLPLDIGIVCHNVGTAAAVARAVLHGTPLISRIVTVSGGAVTQPGNLEVRIGTPVADLIQYCGADPDAVGQAIIGGPMMGYALHDLQAPVIKTTNCVLTRRGDELRPAPRAMPCIRCGKCAEVCPVKLLPQQLYWYAHARDFDKTQDYNLFDCIECGCCAYVCPSHIPLVQYYRFAKTEIWQQERDKHKADIARKRHEFRLERLEREKRERDERHRKKREALKEKVDAGEIKDPKKAAIMAALERVKKKQAAAGVTPQNTEDLDEMQQQQIEDADKRRAAAKNNKTEH